MITEKSDKELAFVYDLFVATDWGERFASLFDEHVKLPEKGRALYLAAGTGGHAIALQERGGEKLKFFCVDENEERLVLARAKATVMKEPAEFHQQTLDALQLRDNRFEIVIGDASLVTCQRVPKMLAEMVRVAGSGGLVALYLPTASSFGEFFSVYWEALHDCGSIHETDVEAMITQLPTVSEVEEMADRVGLEHVTSWTQVEEFDYDSGEAFLSSPLISGFLMREWLQPVPKRSRDSVAQGITRIINEDRHGSEFALSVKATLVVGRKRRSQ
jgi:ubiquinone/menaquinone biosynthesis C-methylase UbiE